MKRKYKKGSLKRRIRHTKEKELLIKRVLRKVLRTLKKCILLIWEYKNILIKIILFILIVLFCIFNVKYLLKLENELNEMNTKVEILNTELDTQTEENQKLKEELNSTKTELDQKIEEVKTSKAKQKEEQKKAAEAEALRVARTNTTTVTSRGGTTSRTISTPAVTGTVAEYQAYAKQRCSEYGWTDGDFNNLVILWNKESGWNPNAHNSSSGAHGIAQALPASKMAAYGSDYLTNYKVQINWGLDYIKNRYGNPTNAMNHFWSKNWY